MHYDLTCTGKTKGDGFPFNQNFLKFGNCGKWYRRFPEKFPEIPETFEFPNHSNSNHSTENSRTFGNKVEWKETFREKCFQKFGCTSRGCPLFGNFGKCCANRYWKSPKIQTGCFGWMKRAQNIQTKEDYCHIAVSISRFFVVTTWHCLNYSFLTNMPRRRVLWIKDPK